MISIVNNRIAIKISIDMLKGKKTNWNHQFKKWFEEWDTQEERCSRDNRTLKIHIQKCYRKGKLKRHTKGKYKYYIGNVKVGDPNEKL